jgi:hypothetical protein
MRVESKNSELLEQQIISEGKINELSIELEKAKDNSMRL